MYVLTFIIIVFSFRQFFLILITKKVYYSSNPINIAEPILSLIEKEVDDYFMVVKYYKSEVRIFSELSRKLRKFELVKVNNIVLPLVNKHQRLSKY